MSTLSRHRRRSPARAPARSGLYDDADSGARMTGTRHIIAALRELGAMTAVQLTGHVQGWTSQTSRDLRRLERQGYVRRLGDGRWEVTTPGVAGN